MRVVRGTARKPPAVAPPASVLFRVPTTRRVVFLTIDDWNSRTPTELAMIRAARVPMTAFPVAANVAVDVTFFRQISMLGVPLEDHTQTHPVLPALGYAAQKAQICGAADTVKRLTGARPTLFRPPYGAYNDTTRKAAAACGFDHVVCWTATVRNGRLQVVGGRLRPGYIILMHALPTWVEDFTVAVRAARQAGLTMAPLTDYVR